jgi:hypothetical protein
MRPIRRCTECRAPVPNGLVCPHPAKRNHFAARRGRCNSVRFYRGINPISQALGFMAELHQTFMPEPDEQPAEELA